MTHAVDANRLLIRAVGSEFDLCQITAVNHLVDREQAIEEAARDGPWS